MSRMWKENEKNYILRKDIHFKQIDQKIMNGAFIELGGHRYETIVPTVREFMKVFQTYLRYRTVTDLKMIKTIALIKDFDYQGTQIEKDVLGATHSDVTLLFSFYVTYIMIVLSQFKCFVQNVIKVKTEGKEECGSKCRISYCRLLSRHL